MRMLFIIAAVITAFGQSASADVMRNFQVAGWSAGAYSFEGTRTFSHCAGSTRYVSGIYMVFSINRSLTWSVGFFNPAWRLNKGSEYDIAFVIDDAQPTTSRATAISGEGVSIQLADSSALFTQFRRGRQLRVAAANQVFTFNLDGTSALLPALLGCVQQENAGGANPFAGRTQPPAGPPSTSSTHAKNTPANNAHQAEATVVLANVMSATKVPGFSILPADEVAQYNMDAAWAGTGVLGALKVVPDAQVDDPKLASVLLGRAAEDCKGAFLSGSLPDISRNKSVRVFTSCGDDKNGVLTTYYLAVRRPKGGLYLFTTFSATQETVKQADENLRQAVFQVVK